MAINTSLLVAAPMLQDVLIDNVTGLPMANGVVTMYQDDSRTTLKNWYYQSGAFGDYNFIPLPNPLTLSGIGTIQDNNGNDVIPFYYPYSEIDNVTPESYYVTVVNSDDQSQFIRQNFPFNNNSNNPVNTTGSTLRNLIVNSSFWRNIGFIASANSLSTILAPDQHTGFSMPDMCFIKNTIDAVDLIHFQVFPVGFFLTTDNPPNQDVTPEYFLQVACTGIGTETYKYLQIPVQLHIKNLEQTQCTFTFWAKNVSGRNTISVNLLEFLGSDIDTSRAGTTVASLTLTNTWEKYIINIPFPSATTGIGNTGDDAWYIQIGFPAAIAFDSLIAKPCLYIGDSIPSNEFETYSAIESVINSPRTGDIRTSLNDYTPPDWIFMNDGTIGNATSGADNIRPDNGLWPLFNLIWNKFVSSPTYIKIYTSTGVLTTFGASAYADYNASKRLSLTKAAGRVFANIGAPSVSDNLYVIPGASNLGQSWGIGETTGAEQHTQSLSELASHTHTTQTRVAPNVGSGATNLPFVIGNATNILTDAVFIDSSGGGSAFPVINPVTFMYVFIHV